MSALAGSDYACVLPKIADVKVTGGFWLPRLETNRLVTLKTDFEKCELARIPNFTNAAIRAKGTFKGIPFDDSDVFKVVEGAAYTLATHPDPELEAYVDRLIGWMARAQEEDGYLYTARTLGMEKVDGFKFAKMMGPMRWSNLGSSHELYNAGHMYEAAVAYWEATGKRGLLDVAVKSADLIDRSFGPGEDQLKRTSGHEEIELALCRLYRATGERRYLDLAKFLLEMRGRRGGGGGNQIFTQSGDLADGGQLGAPGSYNQDHLPVTLQREAVGHAVRAVYLYCGMADVAALTGNDAYAKAIDALWENVVSKKLHLNGSVGARRRGEAFGANYELPNAEAYLETCAGIGNALWNERMFMMYGDAKYIDVLERAIYNGIISGVSLGGDEFFYPNPLASKGGYARAKWFSCSCCPVNIVRFIPQIPRFAYATRGDAAYVNLFMKSEARLALGCGDVALSQDTEYPWNGDVRISVRPPRDGARFALNLRVPGWCIGRPVPSDLYAQVEPGALEDFKVKVNGRPFAFSPKNGYCVVERAWKSGDRVEIRMEMPVRRIRAHEAVDADRTRLAVERGPILYCAEGVDNGGSVLDRVVLSDAAFSPAKCNVLGSVFPALTAPAARMRRTGRRVVVEDSTLTLIPYFAWCHRGAGEMQTWFPAEANLKFAPPGDGLSASYCFNRDTVEAAMDGVVPKNSGDKSIRRLTFWPHKGTEEWVACEFATPEEVSGAEVYWYDDTHRKGGECSLPASWRMQWRSADGKEWSDIGGDGLVAKDTFCAVNFPRAVKAGAVRLVVKLKDGFSAGILEWRLK